MRKRKERRAQIQADKRNVRMKSGDISEASAYLWNWTHLTAFSWNFSVLYGVEERSRSNHTTLWKDRRKENNDSCVSALARYD